MQSSGLRLSDTVTPYAQTLPFTKISAGTLSLRLAMDALEIEAAQRLRYKVFCEEMGGVPSEEGLRLKRDFDVFDTVCDHLLVIDETLPDSSQVVGTYRLLRRAPMEVVGAFYTESEYDISCLKALPDAKLLELGRSCVDANYRNRAVMQLLWRGIGAYVSLHGITHMFGCASFNGTHPEAHAEALSYLYHYHLAPVEIRARALPHLYNDMNMMPKEQINVKEAFAKLPALLKGYIRVGGFVGDGAFIDRVCNTTDVNIVVPSEGIREQYKRRYTHID